VLFRQSSENAGGTVSTGGHIPSGLPMCFAAAPYLTSSVGDIRGRVDIRSAADSLLW